MLDNRDFREVMADREFVNKMNDLTKGAVITYNKDLIFTAGSPGMINFMGACDKELKPRLTIKKIDISNTKLMEMLR